MQTLEIVQMHDTKTNTWSIPHFVPSVAGWQRAVQDEINSNSSQQPFAKHPEDFTAWNTGTWNDNDNKLEWKKDPKFLGQLSDLVITRS